VQRYTNFIASTTATNSTLTVLSNASCVVYIAGTLGAATLYSDNGVTPLANPFLSSATGRIDFYAANGRYDVVVSKTGYLTVTISDIELDDLLAPSGSNSVGYLPAGTGAVATTVQTKLREVVSAKDFGAVGDGVTDDRAAIQAALNTGAQVRLEKLTYLISSALLIPSGGGLIGLGTVQSPPAAFEGDVTIFVGTTRILAAAGFPAARALVEVNTAASANYAIQSAYVGNLVLDCNSVAQKGLEIRTVKHSVFENLFIRLATSIGLNVICNSIATATVRGNNATQFNSFSNITSYVAYNGNVTAAVGIYLDGNANNNVNQNNWANMYVVHGNGNGIEIHNADADLWSRVNTFAWGTGYGCVLFGDDVGASEFARNIVMTGVQFSGAFGTGGLLAKTGVVTPSNFNIMFGYSQGNSSPAPIVENGARFNWYPELGLIISDPGAATETFNRTNSFTTGSTISDRLHQGKITAGGVVTFIEERVFSRGGAGTESGEYVLHSYDAGTAYEMIKVSHAGGFSVGGGAGIKKILSATAALDFPLIAAQSSADLTVTVTGAALFDVVAVGLPANGISASVVTSAFVSAADTVTVRVLNVSALGVDPPSQSYRITVFNYT